MKCCLFVASKHRGERPSITLVTQLSDVATNQGAHIAKIDRMAAAD